MTSLMAFILIGIMGWQTRLASSTKAHKYIVLEQICIFFSSGQSLIHTAGSGSLTTQEIKMELNSPFSFNGGFGLNKKRGIMEVF